MSLLTFADLVAVKYTEWIDMEAIPEEDPLRVMEITVGFAAALPPIKYHDGPLQFLSKPLVTQQEYARRILDARPASDTTIEDDVITIRCSNGSTVEAAIFRIARSALARSPAFQTFFESEFYAPNCGMSISFMTDPAAVFDIVKRYLEEGPDKFDITSLRVHLYRRYSTVERETVLVRLCRMAHNMALWYLHEMAYDILVDGNRFITADMLPMLAGFVFASRSNYHQNLKDWCLMHVGHHFLELKHSRQWANALRLCEQVLTTEWNKMLEQNADILFTLDNHSDEKVLENKIHRLSYQEQDRAISVLGEKKARDKHISEEVMINGLRKELRRSNEDDEWEDINTPSSGEVKADTDSDDRTLMGISTRRDSLQRDNSTENAKARQVMGINHPEKLPPKGKKLKRKRGRIISMLGSPRPTSKEDKDRKDR